MRQTSSLIFLLLFAAAVGGFALTAHRESWIVWRCGFLTLVGVGLCGSLVFMEEPMQTIIGSPRKSWLGARIIVVGSLGVFAAMGYRCLMETTVVPDSLHWFALTAICIGATEELLWRGWMQGVLMKTLGPACAVLVAAASHTAYKTALFVFPPEDIPLRTPGALLLLAIITFGFGAMLGCFRVRQGIIAASVVFHVFFDLIVYGQYPSSPWWVL